MSEERFVEIETKITHQEFLIEQLNKVIYEQQTKIDQLEATLNALGKRLQSAEGAGRDVGPGNEKPPHY